MKNEDSIGAAVFSTICVMLIVCIFTGMIANINGIEKGYENGIQHIKQEAVKSQVAKWTADEKGQVQFQWISDTVSYPNSKKGEK